MRKRILFVFLVVVAVTSLLASVFTVASRSEDTGPAVNIDYPTIAAHRGGKALHPENTLTAFKATAENHPGMPLEMDVMALKDGTLVLSHDTTVDRVAVNATGKVADMTRTQWARLRIKHPNGGAPAPASTLDEVVTEFEDTNTPLVIELKAPTAIDQFTETLWPIKDQVIVQSFDTKIASRLARSGLHTLQLSGELPDPIVKGVEHVGISNKNVTKQFVDNAHNQGVKVWVWGDDVTASMLDTDTRGVDGFIANNPER